jgi:hypothetical protein
LPARKLPPLAATRPGLARKQSSRQRELRILAQRDRLIVEIAQLRERVGCSTEFIDKASTLLTRWWSSASWKAREQLLKSAAWLVQLEQRRGDEMQPSA